MDLRELVILNEGLRYSPALRDGKPKIRLLPKDSAELARLENVYGLPVNMFQAIVDVNNVVKAMDKEEVLDGDHQISAKAMMD
jgi:hypothetical protein